MDETGVCNEALGLIGHDRISSMDEDSEAARECARFYAHTRDEVLRGHPWNFAIKRATLSKLADAPDFGWEHAYQLPTDFMRLVQLNELGADSNRTQWEIEGSQLLTNEGEAQIRYVRRITNASEFDVLFVSALALKLASKLAIPLTGSTSLMEAMLTQYEKISLPRAKAIDAAERQRRNPLPWVTSHLVRARR